MKTENTQSLDASPVGVENAPTPARRLAVIISLYAFGGFVCALILPLAPNLLLGLGLLCLAIGGLQTVCIWSVLGTNHYWKRLLLSHGLFLLVCSCWFVGLILPVLFLDGFYGPDVISALLIVVAFIIPLSIAGQVPYWLARGFLGWKFLSNGEESKRGFTIRDLLIFTFLIALAISAINLSAYFAVGEVRPASPVVESDSSMANEDAHDAQFEQLYWFRIQGLIACGIAMVISTLIGLPILYFVFRSKGDDAALVFVWAIGLSILVMFCLALSFGRMIDGFAIIALPIVLGCSLTTFIPIVYLKSTKLVMYPFCLREHHQKYETDKTT